MAKNATRNDVLEEAAKVADRMSQQYVSLDHQIICEAVAAAIRSLKTREASQ